MSNRVGKLAGVIALVALAIAVVIWEFGGSSIRIYGLRITARSWWRPLIVGVVAAAIFIWRGDTGFLEPWISQWRRRFRPGLLVAGLCLAGAVTSFFLGSHIASGSDPYGYISQADLWKRGSLEQPQSFATGATWPNAEWSFTPLGYRPSVSGDAIVPTYSAGYPLLLTAAGLVAGPAGAFLVVPLCFALVIWATYRLGDIVASPTCGFIAAALVAVSPAVSFSALWPMSDIPALAFWTLCLATVPRQTRAAPLVAGLCASVAILIRPNLFPVAGVIALWMLFDASPIRRRLLRASLFSAGTLPGVLATAAINARLYGSPFQSGYPGLAPLFAISHVPINLSHWATWLSQSQTPFVFLAVVPLLLPLRRWWTTRDNHALWLLGPFALTVALLYVAYEPFNAWWFLRFLLPVFPPLMVGAGLVLMRIAGTSAWRTAGVAIALAILCVHLAHRTTELGAPGPKILEGRYYDIAKFVNAKTPANALFITQQHSGSLRYYAHRMTMRLDYLGADSIPAVLKWCADHGYRPYVLVEEWELKDFRSRFPAWSDALEPSLTYRYAGGERVYIYDAVPGRVEFETIPAGPIPLVPRPF